MRLHSSLNKTERAARIHYFKTFRRNNPETPVLALWRDAMRHVFFRADLAERVKLDKKRSKAAKRGWKTRREFA